MAVGSGAGPGDFTIPDALPVLPLRDAVVLPLTAVPLGGRISDHVEAET